MIDFYDMNGLMEADLREFVKTTAEKAIDLLSLPRPVDVSISIVTAEEIRELNAEQREIDKVTDVLSFPMLYFENPKEEAAFAEEEITALNPETGNLFLGDIILCFDKAREQAEEYGHSLERELAFLTIHSLLHLVGYDHMTAEEETQMFDYQTEILNLLNIRR